MARKRRNKTTTSGGCVSIFLVLAVVSTILGNLPTVVIVSACLFALWVLFKFVGSFVALTIRNKSNKTVVTPHANSAHIKRDPISDYWNTVAPHHHKVDTDKQSKIASIFTQKWYDAVCEEFVVVDIETTGLSKDFDHIIEIAAIRYEGGVEQEKFTTLVKPPFAIPEEAIAIHHITNAMVNNAPPISSVISAFLDFVGESILVGHNANFDISFLEIAAREQGFSPSWRYIDTISVAKKAYPGLPNYKQQTVLRAIGYKQPSEHRAEDDARGCAYILTQTLVRIANGEAF